MEFDKEQLESDKIQFSFLLGKHFKYKERFDDVDFTFVKIISFHTHGGMICDSFCKGDLCDTCIIIGRTVYNFNEIHNMTEIPKEEFYYEIKKLLNVMGLEVKP
jgi:hypothetical protein